MIDTSGNFNSIDYFFSLFTYLFGTLMAVTIRKSVGNYKMS